MKTTMRAMVIDRFGGPEVLRERTIMRPIAKPDNVVVQVACGGVNPADWKAYSMNWVQHHKLRVMSLDGRTQMPAAEPPGHTPTSSLRGRESE